MAFEAILVPGVTKMDMSHRSEAFLGQHMWLGDQGKKFQFPYCIYIM